MASTTTSSTPASPIRISEEGWRSYLDANGHDLDKLALPEQRQAAREYIEKVERRPRQDADEPTEGDTDPALIPDAIVEEALDNADFRRLLDEMLVKSGSPKLADLDADEQRAVARAMIAAMAQSEDETASRPASEAAPPRPRAPPPAPPRPAAAGPPVPSPSDPPRAPAPPRAAAAAPPAPAQPKSGAAARQPPAEERRNGGILRRVFGSFMRRGT